MTRRTLSLVLSGMALIPAGLLAWPRDAAAQSQDPPRPREGREGRPPRGEGGGEGRPERRREGPSVEGGMKALDRAVEQLQSLLSDAGKRDDSLKLLGEAQRALGGAKAAPMPKKILNGAKDAAAKAKIEDKYRRDLLAASQLLLDIEKAVLDKKGDIGSAKLKELADLRDKSHKELGVEE